jgi:predicted Rossmann fold nucleotide-binding protein DprA/Smf involved in DNA uptake
MINWDEITSLRVAIVGSRAFPTDDLALVDMFVDMLPPGTTIVSGGAAGVDRRAEARAKQRGLSVEIIKPNWDQFGRAAGPIRNKEIVNKSDMVVAFWDGKSIGTLHTIKRTEQVGKLVLVVRPRGHYQRRMENVFRNPDQ